jgi:electron transfer flavoprotein beta subunit
MNIAVVMRQVPDLIEPLEIGSSGNALDWDEVRFIVNEADDHALEQALLLKEAGGGSVTVVALDFGEIDDTLYTAAAKGADRIIKISRDADAPPSLSEAAALYADAIKPLGADLVLAGTYAHDELEGVLAPLLALRLGMPYVGVIRGVKAAGPSGVEVFKEFPGAAMARMGVKLPAVLGILAAEKPPRYVPVSRIRAAMKSTQFEEQEAAAEAAGPAITVRKMYHPAAAERAEMLDGSEDEVAARIVELLAEKGLVK